jgi:hypothetical protein
VDPSITKTGEPPAPSSDQRSVGSGGLRFGLMEFAIAFGDLGTLVPFLVAYITLANVDAYACCPVSWSR